MPTQTYPESLAIAVGRAANECKAKKYCAERWFTLCGVLCLGIWVALAFRISLPVDPLTSILLEGAILSVVVLVVSARKCISHADFFRRYCVLDAKINCAKNSPLNVRMDLWQEYIEISHEDRTLRPLPAIPGEN